MERKVFNFDESSGAFSGAVAADVEDMGGTVEYILSNTMPSLSFLWSSYREYGEGAVRRDSDGDDDDNRDDNDDE